MTKKNTRKPRTDVHERVTAQIIEALEAGAGEWQMPWHRAGSGLNRPNNADTKNSYKGINVLTLWIEAMSKGYGSGTWATYRQWTKQGCQVRKGEQGSLVVFYKEIRAKEQNTESEQKDGPRLVARASTVFNAEQVDGYEGEDPLLTEEPLTRLTQVERFLSDTHAEVRHGGGKAYYDRTQDYIQMPMVGRFVGSSTSTAADAYYSTLLHELTHWSGKNGRCARELGKRFGDDAYAMEELVAELGSAFLCADLQVAAKPRPDHAAYLDHWLRVLKADNRAIFTAASQASKATDYLHQLAS